VKWRPIVITGLAVAALAVLVIWLQHARLVGHWVQVHTGIVNEPGPITGSGLDSAPTLKSSAFSARSPRASTRW
jgi:hypothetical protein